MNITLLGTCSGTEPMPGRHHVSFAIESGGWVYWFDAGESCSHTGHTHGLDLLRVRAIFISHPHIDHTGGLANLVWTMHKLDGRNTDPARALGDRKVPLFLTSPEVWEGVRSLLGASLGRPEDRLVAEPRYYSDGPIYDDGTLRVQARHNTHLGHPAPGQPWRAFSFRIEAEGKAMVYSGDIGHVSELDPLLEGAELVLMETGHHGVREVCQYLAASDKRWGRLGFIHHGRAILGDPEGQLAIARGILGDRVFIGEDGMRLTV
ncbi:MAG: MBL fold metallo-hydrolase [Anaerolineae bacterium]